MANKVIVTGCSGFLGRALVHKLLQQNYQVTGVSRADPNIPGMQHIAVDLTHNSIPYLGAEIPIIHCAGLTQEGNSHKLAQVNIKGTRQATQLAGGRFIHISSSSIYDLSHDSILTKESAAQANTHFYNEYSRTKYEAEKFVLADDSRDTKSIVLRPHAIYGPGDTTLLPRLKHRIHHNVLTLPAGGNVSHNLTHIDNLLQAILLSLTAPEGVHGAFNITDADAVNLGDAMREITGGYLRIRNLPLVLALPISRLAEAITPAGREPMLSEYAVRQVGMNRTYDISKAKKLLGFNPSNHKLLETYLDN